MKGNEIFNLIMLTIGLIIVIPPLGIVMGFITLINVLIFHFNRKTPKQIKEQLIKKYNLPTDFLKNH